ncbi:MAG TPA: hypothetical protein DEP82_14580 [Arthrobacter bacterium]|nr:hypothetical protein [Arthrobacter sp.]
MATFLDIHDEAVQSFIREGGAVHALLNDVAKDTRDYAVTYISTKGHIRSGRLLRGQFWNRAKLEGPLQGVARAGSSARHSVWFHDGTGSVISHPNMLIPRDRRAAMTSTAFKGAGAEAMAAWKKEDGKKPVMYRGTVRGQKAKPFLTEGLAASLAKQRLK